MQEYELTNAQRACFGLAPVEETWERFYVKTSHFDNFTAIAYADGCTLKKLLRVSDKLYIEEEMEETISPDKETIYPKSAKGKPVKLSAAVLVKRKSRGMCLSYCVKNITLYSADNERNYYDSEMDSAGVSCFDEFVEWVNAWCADTTPDDLADVRAFAAAPRKHVKYREGDVFRFRVGRRAYGYGRILVDYPRMRRENLPFWDIFMGTALECAAYPILTPRTDVSESELAALSLLPSCVMADNRLYYGEYEIVGHIPVTDSENYAAHYGISRDFRERGQGHVILQYGKIMMNRTGVQPVPGCEHFAYNNVGFGLNVNRTILETVTAAEDNTPYWELRHRLHIENDLRNPAFADQRRAIMRQMFGASNEVST
ncbi:MAG: immunity 26/phosphotriesterase HocA family protein [Clostridia bacterium]|nr:immunity 26/phosphotriesterase HocA family protein [Clostridia bacterium]